MPARPETMTQSYINEDSAWRKYQELAEWAMKSSLSDGDDDSGDDSGEDTDDDSEWVQRSCGNPATTTSEASGALTATQQYCTKA